ncbi:putative aldehyde oxidase Art an 7 [Bidens hawaiensis]|uniref:putative aldehyde oxidase Art an 7 n=1 Tax=Bidens hawaiensis TaxID=980011 RepID=UPI0040492049
MDSLLMKTCIPALLLLQFFLFSVFEARNIDPIIPVKAGGGDYTKPEIETNFRGSWVVDNRNVGVGAMQLQLMPNDQVIWFDATTLGPSALKLPAKGNCPINIDVKNQPDCFAHAVAYDWKTRKVKPIVLSGEPWCSSGNLWPNGNMVATGGTFSGVRTIRMLPKDNLNANFIDRKNALADNRWYATNQVLPDGSAIVVGGREAWTIEIVPPSLDFKPKRFDLPFLKQTCTPPKGIYRFIENNLYPFVFLLPDGNVFIFANDRAINLNPLNGQVLKQFPVLPGGSRNYPASGVSALLPLKLSDDNSHPLNVEVAICGGNKPDSFEAVDAKPMEQKNYVPGLKDCHRIHPMNPGANWENEQEMPHPRVMGDLLHLPTGDLIMLNGAKRGTAAWENAIDPNFTPLIYSPFKPMGQRFKEMVPTTIARMYHSSSALLPDTKILVAGSNPHQFYTHNVKFPTELRVEKFSPPYLDPALNKDRPEINIGRTDKVLKYGAMFKVSVTFKNKMQLNLGEAKLTLLYPPFTTHGFSQNQRLIVPPIKGIANNVISALAPSSGKIAPPGYYLLFVNRLGVPGQGIWVHID